MDLVESDSVSMNRKIVCIDIPEELINKKTAKNHFVQFGRVVRMIIRPRSKSCTVEYDSAENAQRAMLNAGEYMGNVFTVNWYEKPKAKRKTKKERDPDWMPDPELQEELNAMAAIGSGDFSKTYNLRPEVMAVDAEQIKNPVRKLKKPVIRRSWTTQSKKKVDTIASSNAWTCDQLELLNILKQPALTVEEKYKVLEARDKLIRLRTKKQTDLAVSTHTIGTCPDMCPEKERLMREVQHQVALYEQDANGRSMNPALAIKQYSRSSADQEAPLPHELRPVSILQLTMGYLMHRIMNWCDSPDVNLADWYHFLWDRTRSIRKDITQQELCSQGSVELLEQCARFHIHCSARLTGEDPSVFDQKINTENLTKCLQTLKYMYHDLSLKDESCRNEAEFRAYIILLNLNDGNFMWEVQQLKLEIQKSHEVKFALQVYSAINKNNFVKFFKLVHSTNYLNACILLRYFVQVRSRAIATILKCYSPRAPYTQFSIIELEKLLAFEDADSTVDFVATYGLDLNSDETHVILDRRNFSLPKVPYGLDRAIIVVESKRKSTVGEVVYGGSLPSPEYQNYVPYNSFDNGGVFIIPDVLADTLKEAESSVVDLDKNLVASSGFRASPVTTSQSSESSIFAKTERKPIDPSLPFWSVKTEPASVFSKIPKEVTSTTGTLEKSEQNIFKQFTFKRQPEEPSIFGQQPPTTSIFGNTVETAPTSSIFGKQFNALQQPPALLGNAQNATIFDKPEKQTENIFGNQTKPIEQQETNIFTEAKPTNIFQEFKLGAFGTDATKGSGLCESFFPQRPTPDETDAFSTNLNDSSNESKSIFGSGTFQLQKQVMEYNTNDILGSNKMVEFGHENLKDRLQAEETQNLRKLEEQRRIKQENEEKLRLKKEQELKAKAELLKKQEEERIRLENKRLELERARRLEEQKQAAIRIEKERRIALEIKQSVATLMDDMLYKVEENLKRERLHEIGENIKNHKISLFIKRWLRKTAIKKRKRETMEQNPIWLPSRSTSEEAQELFTDTQSLTLSHIKRYKCGLSIEVPLPLKEKVPKMNVKLMHRVLLKRYGEIYQRAQKEMFWKVSVLLPNFQEFKVGLNHVEEVLGNLFQWKDRYGSTAVVEQYNGSNRLTYAVEKKQGVHVVESNTNGILFVAHEPNELLYKRIKESFRNYIRLSYTPIAILFINNEMNIDDNDLRKILEANRHISNYDIFQCKFTTRDLLGGMEKSLVFLAQSVTPPPPLSLNTLQSFIQRHLTTELWKRISSYAIWNKRYKSCLKFPMVVISLYNQAVDKLKEIAFDEMCMDYPSFSDDFDKLLMDKVPDVLPCDYKYFPSFWKTESYRTILLKTMDSLKLPSYKAAWPPTTERSLEQDIFAYLSSIFDEPEEIFYKIMAVILKNVDPTVDFPKIRKVLWTDIIDVIASQKLNQSNLSLHHTEFHSKSIFQELFVVYDDQKLASFECEEWFYLTNSTIQAQIKHIPSKMKEKRKVADVEFEDFNLDALEKTIFVDDQQSCRKSEIEELEMFMADLEKSMEIHKKICVTFQKTMDALSQLK